MALHRGRKRDFITERFADHISICSNSSKIEFYLNSHHRPDLLIMATATLIMFAPCASGSTWKCLLSCQVLPFWCMRQTTSLRGRQTDDTRGQRNRIFEGWACYNAVAY